MTTREEILVLLKRLAAEQEQELNHILEMYTRLSASIAAQPTQPVKRGRGRPKKVR